MSSNISHGRFFFRLRPNLPLFASELLFQMVLTAKFKKGNRSNHQCQPANTYIRNKMVAVVVSLHFTCHMEIKKNMKRKAATGILLGAVFFFCLFFFLQEWSKKYFNSPTADV